MGPVKTKPNRFTVVSMGAFTYEMSSKKSLNTMVFEQTVLPTGRELPKCPRNVISDDYRFIPLRRRKFEVIRVLDHDFRDDQSWQDWNLANIGSHLLRILLIRDMLTNQQDP